MAGASAELDSVQQVQAPAPEAAPTVDDIEINGSSNAVQTSNAVNGTGDNKGASYLEAPPLSDTPARSASVTPTASRKSVIMRRSVDFSALGRRLFQTSSQHDISQDAAGDADSRDAQPATSTPPRPLSVAQQHDDTPASVTLSNSRFSTISGSGHLANLSGSALSTSPKRNSRKGSLSSLNLLGKSSTARASILGDLFSSNGSASAARSAGSAERLLLAASSASSVDAAKWLIEVRQATDIPSLFLQVGHGHGPVIANRAPSPSSSRSALLSARQAMSSAAVKLFSPLKKATAESATPAVNSSTQQKDPQRLVAEASMDSVNVSSRPSTPARLVRSASAHKKARYSVTATSSAKSRSNAGPTVAASTPEMPLLIIYITTATISLTLYRTLDQVIQLERELRTQFPDIFRDLPKLTLLEVSLIQPAAIGLQLQDATNVEKMKGHSRRPSLMLTKLTKSFIAPMRKTVSPSMSTPSLGASSLLIVPDSGNGHSPIEPTSPSENSNGSMPAAVQQSLPEHSISRQQLQELSAYLGHLSQLPSVRSCTSWQRFYTPSKEDHVSEHLEAAVALEREQEKFKRTNIHDSGLADSAHSRRGTGASHTNKAHINRLGSRTEPSSPKRLSANFVSAADLDTHSATNGCNGLNTVSAMAPIPQNTSREDLQDSAISPAFMQYMQTIVHYESAEENFSQSGNPLPISSISSGLPSEFYDGRDASIHLPAASQDKKQQSHNPDTAINQLRNANSDIIAETSSDQIMQDGPGSVTTLVGSISNAMMSQEMANNVLISAVSDEYAHISPILSRVVSTVSLRDASAHEAELTDALTELSASLVRRESVQHTSVSRIPSIVSSDTSDSQRPVRGKKRSRSRRSSQAPSATDSHSGGSEAQGRVNISDFDILQVLGKGCAGKVLLARYRQTGTVYAIKAIHKYHVLAHRELQHTLTEQSILRKMALAADNPFVVNLRWSFQDDENLFLALDFHSGGDLATQLARWGRLGKDRTRFYAAEIIEGLEGLHKAGIIYRDLKPENILLAHDGHVVLTDFGLSKQFDRTHTHLLRDASTSSITPHWLRQMGRSRTSPSVGSNISSIMSKPEDDSTEHTSTFCGTAEYLAPEVLLGKPYSYPVDMWALGTMLHEMLLGATPFYNEDHSIMYKAVLHDSLNFTAAGGLVDNDTQALLRGLLSKDPSFRMTTRRVKHSRYFAAIDWEFVYNKRYIPPFRPDCIEGDPEDTQNFDDVFLQMDKTFVDAQETREIEAKVREAGHPADLPYDEHGRDVFSDYSFDASAGLLTSNADELGDSLAGDEDAEEVSDVASIIDDDHDAAAGIPDEASFRQDVQEDQDTQSESSPTLQIDKANKGEHHSTVAPAATCDQAQEQTLSIANDSQAMSPSLTNTTQRSENDKDDSDQGCDTGITSACVTDDGHSRSMKEEDRHLRMSSSALESLLETLEPGSEANKAEPLIAHDLDTDPRASIDQNGSPLVNAAVNNPEAELTSATDKHDVENNQPPRVNEEVEDWHLVEANPEESANGVPKTIRRRVIAGPTLFALGIMDRYRMQVRPPSRAGTPTRMTLRRGMSLLTPQRRGSRSDNGSKSEVGSRRGSSANLGQLSPSQSSIAQSNNSVHELSESATSMMKAIASGGDHSRSASRNGSSELLPSSLSSSASPKFRLKRNKKLVLSPFGQSVAPLKEHQRSVTPGSASTLPLEATNMQLAPLTRADSRGDAGSAGAEHPSKDSQNDVSLSNGDSISRNKQKPKGTASEGRSSTLFSGRSITQTASSK